MVELTHEADCVTRLPTAEAVAGEDVVLKNECVARLDNRAIDLFDAIGLLDRLNHPPATGERLRGLEESVGVLVNLEEGLVEILVDKMHSDVAVLSHRTTRKPLLELCVLGADEGRPGAIDGQTTVAVRNPVRDTEGGWNGPSSPAPRVDGNKPVARTQVLGQHL